MLCHVLFQILFNGEKWMPAGDDAKTGYVTPFPPAIRKSDFTTQLGTSHLKMVILLHGSDFLSRVLSTLPRGIMRTHYCSHWFITPSLKTHKPSRGIFHIPRRLTGLRNTFHLRACSRTRSFQAVQKCSDARRARPEE